MVVFVESDRAVAIESTLREREREAPVVGGAEELIEEGREATHDDQCPAAFAGHGAHDPAVEANHRLPALADLEGCALVERDQAGGRGGDGHGHRAIGARPLHRGDARTE